MAYSKKLDQGFPFNDLLAAVIENRICGVYERMDVEQIRSKFRGNPDSAFGFLLEAIVADQANETDSSLFRNIRRLVSGRSRWNSNLGTCKAMVYGSPNTANVGIPVRHGDEIDIFFYDADSHAKLCVDRNNLAHVPVGQDAGLQVKWCGCSTTARGIAKRLVQAYYPCPTLAFGPRQADV